MSLWTFGQDQISRTFWRGQDQTHASMKEVRERETVLFLLCGIQIGQGNEPPPPPQSAQRAQAVVTGGGGHAKWSQGQTPSCEISKFQGHHAPRDYRQHSHTMHRKAVERTA